MDKTTRGQGGETCQKTGKSGRVRGRLKGRAGEKKNKTNVSTHTCLSERKKLWCLSLWSLMAASEAQAKGAVVGSREGKESRNLRTREDCNTTTPTVAAGFADTGGTTSVETWEKGGAHRCGLNKKEA